MDKTEELDKWYDEMMERTLTDSEKNRIQSEYDKRKEKGKGKPFFWIPSAEESNAIMMKGNPQYARNIENKTNQSLRAGRNIAKIAEGLTTELAVASALNGDEETAKELSRTSNKIVKSEKNMKNMYKGKGSDKNKPTESSAKNDDSYTVDKVSEINDGNPKKVDKEIKKEDENKKTTLKDLENSASNEQDKEAYSDAQVYENVTDTLKKDVNNYDKMNELTDKFYEKSSNIDEFYKENLPKSIWSMYKNGEFDGTTGDEKKDKLIGKERLGYLIMNHLGNGLVNASLIARGSSPTQVSDLQKIRNEKLEGALERYNKKRDESMSKTLEQLGLNAELLNKFNLDLDTLKNNKIFEEVSKSRDRKNFERTIKAYKVAGKYLEGLTDKQKKDMGMAIMALNSKDSKDIAMSTIAMTAGDKALDAILDAVGIDE